MLFTKDSNLEQILKENDKVIIDFFAKWCGPCRMLSPILEEIEEENGYKIIKIDVDEFPEIANAFHVSSIPHVFSFEKGTLKGNVLGYLPKEALLRKLNA